MPWICLDRPSAGNWLKSDNEPGNGTAISSQLMPARAPHKLRTGDLLKTHNYQSDSLDAAGQSLFKGLFIF
jgi:hypothetical protein